MPLRKLTRSSLFLQGMFRITIIFDFPNIPVRIAISRLILINHILRMEIFPFYLRGLLAGRAVIRDRATNRRAIGRSSCGDK